MFNFGIETVHGLCYILQRRGRGSGEKITCTVVQNVGKRRFECNQWYGEKKFLKKMLFQAFRKAHLESIRFSIMSFPLFS